MPYLIKVIISVLLKYLLLQSSSYSLKTSNKLKIMDIGSSILWRYYIQIIRSIIFVN